MDKKEFETLNSAVGELTDLVRILVKSQDTQYVDTMRALQNIEDKISNGSVDGRSGDELYQTAKETVVQFQVASASFLQRTLHIGYTRSAGLMDLLQEEGVIGPADELGQVKVLVKEL